MTAERTVSRAMGGSCSMPLAAFIQFTRGLATDGSGHEMQLSAAWGEPASADASAGALAVPPTPLVQVSKTATVRTFEEAEALGEAVAAQLRAGGAVWAANSPAV